MYLILLEDAVLTGCCLELIKNSRLNSELFRERYTHHCLALAASATGGNDCGRVTARFLVFISDFSTKESSQKVLSEASQSPAVPR